MCYFREYWPCLCEILGSVGFGCQYPVMDPAQGHKQLIMRIEMWHFTDLWNFTATFKPKDKQCYVLQSSSTSFTPGSEILQHPKLSRMSTNQTYFNQVIARTRFAYSSGTRKWNPARSQIKKIFHPITTLSIRPWAKISFSYWTVTMNSWILHTSTIWNPFTNNMPVIVVKIII